MGPHVNFGNTAKLGLCHHVILNGNHLKALCKSVQSHKKIFTTKMTFNAIYSEIKNIPKKENKHETHYRKEDVYKRISFKGHHTN